MNTAAQQPVIQINGLTKKFGKVIALNQLNLQVEQGQVHGFLGPNGSGKSTTIRILLGLLRKTGGDIKLFGNDPWKNAVELHKLISYVPGDVNLWPNLSGGEVIDLFADLRGGSSTAKREGLLRDFQLDPRKKCGTYSKGNRQKVALIAALSADVDLYILDEPTSGLDPLMETAFQTHIKQLKAAGKTVLLSSHILAEVEALADTVTIIRNGKTIETGVLSELRHLGQQTVKVTTHKKITGLSKLTGVHDIQVDGDTTRFSVDQHSLGKSIELLAKHGITALTSEPQSLEDLFMKHYDTQGKSTK